jgi:hypothetical protein
MTRTAINRRNFLKYASVAGAAGLYPGSSRGAEVFHGSGFVQQVNHVRLYMTHYALFEEPDPNIPAGIYIDAATGAPTNELTLTLPCETFGFVPTRPNPTEYIAATSGPVKQLPYVVEPPGFPKLAPPAAVVGAIQAVLGGSVPASVIAANTGPFLVAIGHFEPTPGVIHAKLAGGSFAVTRDTEFQVQVRVGFVFEPPAGVPAPRVGILTGWLTHGLVDELIGAAPGPNANDLVVYNWRATMTLSTENRYIRATATEPPPVADGFPAGLDAIRFLGSHVDNHGQYTIVGHAAHVAFDAPPELALFLFGTPVLTDVEFAVEESGVLMAS